MDVDAIWKGKGGKYGKRKDKGKGKGKNEKGGKGKGTEKEKGKRKENRKMVEKGKSFAGHVAGADISLVSVPASPRRSMRSGPDGSEKRVETVFSIERTCAGVESPQTQLQSSPLCLLTREARFISARCNSEKLVRVKTDQGIPLDIQFHVADVRRPIVSANRLVEQGSTIAFSPEKGS
eukprot:6106164-Amphidinium_carterae.5